MIFRSMYGSVSPNSDIGIDLMSLAMNKTGFLDSEYVIFRSGWGEYYLVYGNLYVENQHIYGVDVQYIRYYLANEVQGIYQYEFGSDSYFELYLNQGAFPTSSLDNVGFASLVGTEYKYYLTKTQEVNDGYFQVFSSLFITVLLCLIFVRLGGVRRASD